jgi:tyrosyl-tRNA synthetase
MSATHATRAARMEAALDDLRWRGLIDQVTQENELRAAIRAAGDQPLTVYAGFDPTASSLHIGNLMPLLTLRRLQLGGWRVIAVAGGATGMIGDPSGKKSERSLLDEETLRANVAAVEKQLAHYFHTDGRADLEPMMLVDNYDWFRQIGYIQFLRDVGKNFSVNMMIQKESVKARLEAREQGISYTEFSYMLLQSYDFLHLHREYGCMLQIGGSDQFGNITTGIDLISRSTEGGRAFGMTVPLLLNAAGEKFGKSEGGNVWVDPTLTSPYRLYQFYVRQDDAEVARLLRFYTFLDQKTIEELEHSLAHEPEKRLAQRRLAWEVTALLHGGDAAGSAVRASKVLFGGDVTELASDDWRALSNEIPTTTLDAADLDEGTMGILDLLAKTGLCPSKGQARKDLKAGGVYLNNERLTDEAARIGPGEASDGNHLLLRKGKANYHLVIISR